MASASATMQAGRNQWVGSKSVHVKYGRGRRNRRRGSGITKRLKSDWQRAPANEDEISELDNEQWSTAASHMDEMAKLDEDCEEDTLEHFDPVGPTLGEFSHDALE